MTLYEFITTHYRGRILPKKKAPATARALVENIALEATTGFEPVMEVLQTSALPLGYVAKQDGRPRGLPFENQSGRRDSNPWPSPWQGDVLPLNHARMELTDWSNLNLCQDPDSNWGHLHFQ